MPSRDGDPVVAFDLCFDSTNLAYQSAMQSFGTTLTATVGWVNDVMLELD